MTAGAARHGAEGRARSRRHRPLGAWAPIAPAVVLAACLAPSPTAPAADRMPSAPVAPPGAALPAGPPTDQLGGAARAVAVADGRAYVAIGPRLVVVDVGSGQAAGGDPGAAVGGAAGGARPLRALGRTAPAAGTLVDVAVAGRHAVVVGPGADLTVVDVARPADPMAVGVLHDVLALRDPAAVADRGGAPRAHAVSTTQALSTPRPVASPAARAVAAKAGTAYVVGIVEPGSVPSRVPGAAADAAVATAVQGVAASGADRTGARGRMVVVDTSDPAAPRATAHLDLAGRPADIALAGGLAFIAAGDGGTHVVDVRDPANPRAVGRIGSPARAVSVAVADGVAYVAEDDPLGAGLQIADVRDPAAPREIASLTLARRRADVAVDVRAVAVDGTDVWIATADGVRHVDARDPRAPREVPIAAPALSLVPAPGAPAFGGVAVAAVQRRALVLDAARGLAALAPVGAQGGWAETALWSTPTTVTDVAAAPRGDGLLVVAAGRALAVDPRRPLDPAAVAAVDAPGRVIARAASGDEGLYLVGVAPPAGPADPVETLRLGVARVGGRDPDGRVAIDAAGEVALGDFTFDTPSLAAVGGRVWVRLRDGIWAVVEAGPAERAPQVVGRVERQWVGERLVTVDDRLVVVGDDPAAPRGRLAVLGVGASDGGEPLRPRELGTVDVPAGIASLAVDGSRVVVGADGGLAIVDVAAPAQPVVRAVSGPLPGRPVAVVAAAGGAADCVVAALAGGGLIAWAPPAAPAPLDGAAGRGLAVVGLAMWDGRLWLAAGDRGLVSLAVSGHSAPTSSTSNTSVASAGMTGGYPCAP